MKSCKSHEAWLRGWCCSWQSGSCWMRCRRSILMYPLRCCIKTGCLPLRERKKERIKKKNFTHKPLLQRSNDAEKNLTIGAIALKYFLTKFFMRIIIDSVLKLDVLVVRHKMSEQYTSPYGWPFLIKPTWVWKQVKRSTCITGVMGFLTLAPS